MNKSESKYFNTAIRMDEAFLELLEKKNMEYITVKEICEKARVNRSTFYLHYENMGDLLEECLSYLYKGFLEYFKKDSSGIVARIRDCSVDELYLVTPEYLKPYLTYIAEHRRLFRTAVDNSVSLRLGETYDQMFCHVFTPILERFHVPEENRNYLMSFYIHGLMAIITEWLKQDCTDSIENVISIIRQCVMGCETDRKDL